eukprot:2753825-Lingulodinium_polyedra.AAC.1
MRSNQPSAAATARKLHARALHARTKTGALMECANVRFASRYGRGRSIRPHRCVAFCKRCTKM